MKRLLPLLTLCLAFALTPARAQHPMHADSAYASMVRMQQQMHARMMERMHDDGMMEHHDEMHEDDMHDRMHGSIDG